jgi:hypothetical protein
MNEMIIFLVSGDLFSNLFVSFLPKVGWMCNCINKKCVTIFLFSFFNQGVPISHIGQAVLSVRYTSVEAQLEFTRLIPNLILHTTQSIESSIVGLQLR